MAHSTSDQSVGSFAALLPLGAHAKTPPIPIKRPLTLIGSRKEVVRIHLESSTVSKVHCAIVLNDWGCYVHDLASRTHTLVNGEPVSEADLHDGDVLQIGRFQFKYVAPNFVAPKVEPVAGELVVSTLTDALPIRGRMLQVGRRPGSDLQFDDVKVSNVHALLFAVNDGWQVRDLGSRTGVWVGGKLARQEAIDDGSKLKIGGATLIFRHRHLDDADDDELDLAAPLTLAEAPAAPFAPGAPHSDLASPPQHDSIAGDDVPLDLNDVAPDLTVEPDAIPSADALAALRRNWRAPVAEAPADEHAVKPRPPHPEKTAPIPLDDDAVADLLTHGDIDAEPVDLADLLAEPISPENLKPDNPAAAAPPVARQSPPLAPRPKPEEQASEPPAAEPDFDADTIDSTEIEETIAEAPAVHEPVAIEPTVTEPPVTEPTADASTAIGDEFEFDLEPLELDAAVELEAPAAEATFRADDAVAELPRALDPLLDETPAVHEPVAAEPSVTEPPVAEPIADASTAIEDEFEFDLEPLELDEAAVIDIAAPVADASFPADAVIDESTHTFDPVLDDLSPATEPDVAERTISKPAAEVTPAAGEAFDLELEPLELDEAAVIDLAAPIADTSFPADAKADESTHALDPMLDELPAAADAVVAENTIPEPAAADATPTAEDGFDLDLEPLELDEGAAVDLAAPATAELFPADESADDIAPVSDALPSIAEPAGEIDLGGLLLEQDEDAVVNDDAAATVAEIRPPHGWPRVAEIIQTPEAAEIAALGDEPEPVEDLADIKFDFELDDELASLVAEAPVDEFELELLDDAPLFDAADVDTVDAGKIAAESSAKAALDLAELDLDLDPLDEPALLDKSHDTPAESKAGTTDSAATNDAAHGDIHLTAGVVSDEAAMAFLDEPDGEQDEVTAAEVVAEHIAPISGDTVIVEEPQGEETVADELILSPSAEATPTDATPADATPAQSTPAQSTAAESARAESAVIGITADVINDDAALEFLDEPAVAEAPAETEEEIASARDKIIPPVVHFDERPAEIGLSLATADEDDESIVLDESVTDTAMALDLSAFIDKTGDEDTDDEPEWEDAPPVPEPVMESPQDDIPPPSGGTLRDLIPDGPPLMGGMFTPAAPMSIGGSPVLHFNTAPPAPPQNGRRRPLRTSFGRSSPFSGQSATISESALNNADMGDSALMSDGPGTSIDVFSTPSPTAEDLQAIAGAQAAETVDETTLAPVEDDTAVAEAFVETAPSAEAPLDRSLLRPTEEDEIRAVAELFRPRYPVEPGTIPVIPFADAAAAAKLRRGRYRRIMSCLIATFVLVPAGVAAVYLTAQQYSVIDATINYERLDSLGIDDARSFRQSQNDLVESEQVRQAAVAALPADDIKYGFLSDPKLMQAALDHDPAVRWPADRPTAMRLRVNSLDKAGDIARIRALAEAVIRTSATKRDQLDQLQDKVQRDTAAVSLLRQRMDTVGADLQDILQAGNTRPDLAQISKLQDARAQAEAVLTTIKSQRQELEAAVQVLQRPGSASVSPPSAKTVKPDDALDSLTHQLTDLQKQAAADKTSASDQAAAARKALDDSIAQFQDNLKGAQQLKQSPELAAYVDAANRIFIQTRELTEDLIRRQENQRTQLAELKARFDENVENSTKERLDKDEQLKKLRDRLAIETRQFNAATDEGDTIGAKKVELDIQLVKSLIAGREDLVTNDPIYSQTAQQLQQVIDTIQQSIVDDRKHIDEKLSKVQQDFSLTAPAVEKLPDEQKQLADSMEKRLIAVNEARKAYDSAADDALAQQAKIEADQKTKASGLQLEIAARKQEIADATAAKSARDTELARQQKLADTQAQLVQVRQKEQQAQQALDDTITANDNAERQRKAFVESDARRNELQEQKAAIDQKLTDARNALNRDQAAQAGLIVPDRKIDMANFDQPDRRPIYAAGVGSAIFVLLMIPVLWTLRLTSRDAHQGHPMPLGGGPIIGGPNGHGANVAGHGFDPVLPGRNQPALEDPASMV